MAPTFEAELSNLRSELEDSRATLLKIIVGTPDSELDAARRGGWSIRRVLEHVITSEESYARIVAHLRGRPIHDAMPEALPSSISEATSLLASSRRTLLDALDGVDEDSFYELKPLGKEEYSIVSVLENVISHDHEHGVQLDQICNAQSSRSRHA